MIEAALRVAMRSRATIALVLAVSCLATTLAHTRVAAQGITVTPANPTVSVGQTQQFTASGTAVAAAASAMAFHACALLADGTVRCWGLNDWGQIGNGARGVNASTPAQVVGLAGAVQVAVGGFHTCARFANGTLACWGANDARQLGDPNTTADSATAPVPVGGITTATAVASGGFHTCALLADTTVRCWGLNDSGQLGDGTAVASGTPVAVSGLTGVVAIAAGGWHTCALLGDGTARCWGQNTYGQLGNGSFANALTPSPVAGLADITRIPSGIFHHCAIRQDGTLFCWGRNDEGRLGIGTTTTTPTPTAVSGITVTDAHGGGEHSCGLLTDGSVRCWGWNDFGQLGNGAGMGSVSTPAPPATGISGATWVGTGAEFSCALVPGGVVRCWGRNVYGQLGDGTNTDARTPVNVAGFGGTWSSSDTAVATIASTGVATALGAGATTITASAGGRSGSTTLTVVRPPTLTVIREGSGAGAVTSAPAGIDCGATCAASYPLDTVVTLTAAPAAGSTFAGWSGGGCTGAGTCTVALSAATTVTATFSVQGFTLTVSRSGAGAGTVTSSPAGIDCGATCAATYAGGTTVTLTAAPAGGSAFTGWSGGGCTGAGTCVVTMAAATSVTATFTVQTFTLGVNRAGTGTGTVTSAPAGISCGSTCAASYAAGTTVTLTATPAGGSAFTGWSGGGCTGAGTCVVTMAAATSVTATFTVQTFTLGVNRAGTGTGTVTSAPAGISCGSTCTATYAAGTTVTLTAAPAGGSAFTGWSGGGCTGTGPCVVTLTAATTVTAIFDPAVVSAPVLRWQYGGCDPGPYCQFGWYSSPAVADLDVDGRPDVVWGAYDVVALNAGDGSLKWRGAGADRVWPGVVVADLTGNGTLEVVVARWDDVTVYNRSGGVVWRRTPLGVGELRTLAVADLEGDGSLEIVVGATDGDAFQVSVLGPGGAVRPGWPARHAGEPGNGWGAFNQNVAVADMNGDGLKEVFVTQGGHYVNAFDRNGNQLPTSALFDGIDPAGPKRWSEVGVHVEQAVDLRGYANCGVEHRPDFGDSAPVTADVDGDGVPELIVVGSVYDCSTYAGLYQMPFIFRLDRTRWSGGGFDWTVIPTPRPGSAPRSQDYNVIETVVPNPAVADLDGDGRKEIVFPSYDGRVHALWLDKTERGSWPYRIPTSGAAGDDFRFASEALVVDLDNDGRAEVIFTSWPKRATGGVGQLHVLNHLGQELHRLTLPAPALGLPWNGGLGAPTVARVGAGGNLMLFVGTVASGVVAYDLPDTAGARVLWGTGRGGARRAGVAEAMP
jgi:alpha-tubulin suppressor-like RCC1 family protein